MKKLCDVYKSLQHEGMYLYVDREDKLSRVPEELLARCGKLEKTLTFVLTHDRKLAKANPVKVLDRLAEYGFYLQLPDYHQDRLAEFRAHSTTEEITKQDQD